MLDLMVKKSFDSTIHITKDRYAFRMPNGEYLTFSDLNGKLDRYVPILYMIRQGEERGKPCWDASLIARELAEHVYGCLTARIKTYILPMQDKYGLIFKDPAKQEIHLTEKGCEFLDFLDTNISEIIGKNDGIVDFTNNDNKKFLELMGLNEMFVERIVIGFSGTRGYIVNGAGAAVYAINYNGGLLTPLGKKIKEDPSCIMDVESLSSLKQAPGEIQEVVTAEALRAVTMFDEGNRKVFKKAFRLTP